MAAPPVPKALRESSRAPEVELYICGQKVHVLGWVLRMDHTDSSNLAELEFTWDKHPNPAEDPLEHG